jgi:hypothetical protein
MLVSEWNQVPASNVPTVKSLSRRVEDVIAAKGGPAPYWNEMFDEQVSTYFWPCSVYKNKFTFQHTHKQLGFHEFSGLFGE